MGKQLLYFARRCHFLVMIVNDFEIDLPGHLNVTCTARKKTKCPGLHDRLLFSSPASRLQMMEVVDSTSM